MTAPHDARRRERDWTITLLRCKCGHMRLGSWLPDPCPVCRAESGFEPVEVAPVQSEGEHAEALEALRDVAVGTEPFDLTAPNGESVTIRTDRERLSLIAGGLAAAIDDLVAHHTGGKD